MGLGSVRAPPLGARRPLRKHPGVQRQGALGHMIQANLLRHSPLAGEPEFFAPRGVIEQRRERASQGVRISGRNGEAGHTMERYRRYPRRNPGVYDWNATRHGLELDDPERLA